MITVAILTWLAFFAILFELDWKWTYGTHHMWHSILGVIVLVCAFLAVRLLLSGTTIDVRLSATDWFPTPDAAHQTLLLLVLDPLVDHLIGSLFGRARDLLGHGQSSLRFMELVFVAPVRLVYLPFHRSIDLRNSRLLLRSTRLRT